MMLGGSAHCDSRATFTEEMLLPTSRNHSRAAIIGTAILAAACVIAAPARAESIYRSIGPDGEVTYSSQPVPGARESTVIEIRTLSPEQRRAAQLLRRQENAAAGQLAAEAKSLEEAWRRADREIVSAREALAQAESALQKGRTPLAGERRGNVGGGSRLTEAYFQRLRKAERRVEQAKRRLDRAYAARNALK